MPLSDYVIITSRIIDYLNSKHSHAHDAHTHSHTHTPGNPVLIPSREVLGLERSLRGSSLPFFGVFGSGDPQPLPTDYSWYFNGDPIFINGEIDNSAVDVNAQFDSVTFNRITLKSDINSPIEGTYVSIVNTTAGTTNVSITLDVQGESHTHVFY